MKTNLRYLEDWKQNLLRASGTNGHNINLFNSELVESLFSKIAFAKNARSNSIEFCTKGIDFNKLKNVFCEYFIFLHNESLVQDITKKEMEPIYSIFIGKEGIIKDYCGSFMACCFRNQIKFYFTTHNEEEYKTCVEFFTNLCETVINKDYIKDLLQNKIFTLMKTQNQLSFSELCYVNEQFIPTNYSDEVNKLFVFSF